MSLALAELIGSDLPFESWYRERLQDLHGVILSRFEQFVQHNPPSQLQELLFEWRQTDSAGG